jgi:hypothetical protein
VEILDKWMCSSVHLKLFGFVARMGLALWFFTPAAVTIAPWYYWAVNQAYSVQTFALGSVGLLVFIGVIGVTGFQRTFRVGDPMVLQVELRPGLLGLHIGKQVPRPADMLTRVLQAVVLAEKLGLKAVRIESPLLVRGRRHAHLVSTVPEALVVHGLGHVKLNVIDEKRMLWARSVLFTVMRKLRDYDPQGKHLPEVSWFSTRTRGVLLVLR